MNGAADIPTRTGGESAARPAVRRRAPWFLLPFLAAIPLAIVPSPPESRAAEAVAAGEEQVKAAFLFKFTGYVEWPRESFEDAPFTFAVVGAERLAAELRDVVDGRTVHDRRIAVIRPAAGDQLSGVHVLFVGEDEQARLGELVRAAQPRSILTVTEAAGSLEAGSVINFVVLERRVRFEISLDSAEKSGLRLSSRLLAVAERVLPEAD